MLINNWTKGVDTYTHNGSTWLIFTENKQFVIELTKEKTLWYNYNFFKQIFEFTSLDVVENQHLITKWVEDNVINKINNIRFRDARDNKHQFEDTLKNGVKDTRLEINITEGEVDDIIQDGVKHTKMAHIKWSVEDTIENGVKTTTHLQFREYTGDNDDTIENGVRDTQNNPYENKSWIEGVIKGGVKETNLVIRDGVKETNHVDVMNFFDNKMEDTLNNGVKETIECDWNIPKYVINDVISEGVSSFG